MLAFVIPRHEAMTLCVCVVRVSHRGYVDIAMRLLAAGCPVDAAAVTGETALHLCAANGHNECVRMLLRAGANPTLAARSGTLCACGHCSFLDSGVSIRQFGIICYLLYCCVCCFPELLLLL